MFFSLHSLSTLFIVTISHHHLFPFEDNIERKKKK
jgi:hypothetical protein